MLSIDVINAGTITGLHEEFEFTNVHMGYKIEEILPYRGYNKKFPF